MNREEEIKLLVQHLAKVWYAGANSNLEALFEQAVRWADSHPKNTWRDAKTDPPQEGERVFVSYDDNRVLAYYYGDNYWHLEGYGFCDFIDYWMPIPRLPKGGEK